MSLNIGNSIFIWKGAHCFRTWFIEECHENGIFGVTNGNLKYLTKNNPTQGYFKYDVGTKIYLEDAPYYRNISKNKTHRIIGPYSVITTSDSKDSQTPVYTNNHGTIIYKESYPENGPWFTRNGVERNIDGFRIIINQKASLFDYFPLRFHFSRDNDWETFYVPCSSKCPLC